MRGGGERRRSEARLGGDTFFPLNQHKQNFGHSLAAVLTRSFDSTPVVSAPLASIGPSSESESYVFHGHALASLHVERSGHPPPGAGAPLAGLLISASSLLVAFSRTRASPGGG